MTKRKAEQQHPDQPPPKLPHTEEPITINYEDLQEGLHVSICKLEYKIR